MIESLIIMYAPVVFVYAMQIIGFVQSARKMKRITVKDDVGAAMKPVRRQLAEVNKQIAESNARAAELAEQNRELMDANAELRRDYIELSASIKGRLDDQNGRLDKLVKKNVEWESKARVSAKRLSEVQNERND